MAKATNTLAKLDEIGRVDDSLETREVTWIAPNGEEVKFSVQTKKELSSADNYALWRESKKMDEGDENADVMALRIHRTVFIDGEPVSIERARSYKPSLKAAIINAIAEVGDEPPKA